MPTYVPSIHIKDLLKYLNLIKEGEKISTKGLAVILETLKQPIELISTLFHFTNPEIYPIYGEELFYRLMGKITSPEFDSVESFSIYALFCEFIIQNTGFRKIHELVHTSLGYEVSRFRALELVLREELPT